MVLVSMGYFASRCCRCRVVACAVAVRSRQTLTLTAWNTLWNYFTILVDGSRRASTVTRSKTRERSEHREWRRAREGDDEGKTNNEQTHKTKRNETNEANERRRRRRQTKRERRAVAEVACPISLQLHAVLLSVWMYVCVCVRPESGGEDKNVNKPKRNESK